MTLNFSLVKVVIMSSALPVKAVMLLCPLSTALVFAYLAAGSQLSTATTFFAPDARNAVRLPTPEYSSSTFSGLSDRASFAA